jgi:hypothetical protein
MTWESYKIEQYEVYLVAENTPDFTDIYGYIILYWRNKQRAKLWFYRDGVATIPANKSFSYDGFTNFYGYFRQSAFSDSVDLLRNEKTTFFNWSDASKGVLLSSGNYLVGIMGELP